jgi:hypothetical protein
MGQALSQTPLPVPTNTVGETGRSDSTLLTQSLTVDTTATAVGQTTQEEEKLDQSIPLLDSSASQRPLSALGLSPQSPQNISGASKMHGITSVPVYETLGLGALFAFAIKLLIKISAWKGLGLARWLPWISPVLPTESRVEPSDPSSGATRTC